MSDAVARKARECKVTVDTDGLYRVESPSKSVYHVRIADGGATGWCSCPWGLHHPAAALETGCAHMRAVWARLREGEPEAEPQDAVSRAMAEYRRIRDAGGSEAEACAAADAIVGYVE